MSQDSKTNVRIASKMDTKANLTEYNPVLLDKEVVYERDTGRYKIGDGEKGWNELPYCGINSIIFDRIQLPESTSMIINEITYNCIDLAQPELVDYLDADKYHLEINLYAMSFEEEADLSMYNEIREAYNKADLIGVVIDGINTILIQGEVPTIDLIIQAKVVAK